MEQCTLCGRLKELLPNTTYCSQCVSLKGLINSSYYGQCSSSRHRGHTPPEYDKQEYYLWFTNQENCSTLYQAYVESNYDTKLKPSVDRKDDSKGYSFSNIRLVTWRENNSKSFQKPKRVEQRYKGEMVIDTFESIQLAADSVGARYQNISACCNGRQKSAKGFTWHFID